jgi:preprotein translocase subunit SecE
VAATRRRVAQLVELWSPKPVVVGSSPAAPAISYSGATAWRSPTASREIGETSTTVRRIRRFIDEAWSELKKVTWPTREQVRNLTVLVFVISAAVGVYITIFDVAFTAMVSFLTDQAGGGQ